MNLHPRPPVSSGFRRLLRPFLFLSALPGLATELAELKVLPGFEVQLFATEREGAIKPVQLRFDPDGRLWVAGSTVYPQIKPGEPANDRVTVFEDTDGDGRADKSTVFADDLLIPLGLELGDGGAYVGTATELLHLRDTDGDGRADERRVVLRGFGTGDAHQTINSFTWGPSGELMISQGLHAISRVETPWGLAELRQAGVFRLWPRRLKLDAFWSGAMGAHNPFGTVFDRWGQPFVFAGNGHGVFHLTPAQIDSDHFLPHPSLWQQGRKFGGADIVENSHWPEADQGEVISGGYLQNTVERFRLTDLGSTFKAERLPPLIESTNIGFRIIDARFGPDGALYLADWSNPVIGHYQASLRHPDRDKTSGRIWRVTAAGRPLVPRRKLGPLPIPALLDELKSPERWYRQLAKRTLADRPAGDVIPALRTWVAALGPAENLARFEALGVFASHETIETNLLAQLARAPEPGARAYAARVVGHWATRLARPLDWLAPLAADPHPRVRLEAIVASSYVQDARAVEVAALATDQPLDNHLDYAFTQAVHALKPLWREAHARGELTFGGNARRREAFSRADGSGDTVAEAVTRLRRIGEVALDRDQLDRLTQIVARAGGPTEIGALLSPRTFMVGTNHQAGLQAETLSLLLDRARQQRLLPAGNLPAILSPLLAHAHPGLRQQALRLAGAWQVESLRDPIARLAADAATELPLRRAAVSALGGFAKQEDHALLLALATNASPALLRLDAIRTLAQLDPAAAAPPAAAVLASDNDAAATRDVVTAFLQKKDGPPALRHALGLRPAAAANAREALAVLAASGRRDPELARLLEHAAGQAPALAPFTATEIPAFLAGVRTGGNPVAGKAIFDRPTLGCVSCHATDGAPGKIGPDLGALGTAQTPDFILGALLEPQKEVKEGFMAHEIETRDGEVYQGNVRGETASEITLHDHLSNRTLRFRPDQIASRRQLGSLMPPGLADTLSRDDLRDLVTYLSRLGRLDRR